MRAMNTVFTIFLLGLLGVFIGVLLGRLMRLKKPSAPPHEIIAREPDEAAKRRLIQLKQQLDSGLITKEEYRAEQEKLSLG